MQKLVLGKCLEAAIRREELLARAEELFREADSAGRSLSLALGSDRPEQVLTRNSFSTVVEFPDHPDLILVRDAIGLSIGLVDHSKITLCRLPTDEAWQQLEDTYTRYPVPARGEMLVTGLLYLGGAGYRVPLQSACVIHLSQAELTIHPESPRGFNNFIRVAEVRSVDIGGPGEFQTGGGFMGGGFGVEGAAVGMAVASALNALTSKTEIETLCRISTSSGELFFLCDFATPNELRRRMSPLFVTVAEAGQQNVGDRGSEFVERLERLASLF